MKGFLFLLVSVLATSGNAFVRKDCVLDVGFLLDGSKSMTMKHWRKELFFVHMFERQVRFNQMGTRIGVVSCGKKATVNIKLNQFNEMHGFETALNKIPYRNDNNSSLRSGLRILRTKLFRKSKGDRRKIPNVVIILTDASSVRTPMSLGFEAHALKKKGTKIYAVITKPGVNKHKLKFVASSPSRDYVYGVHRPLDLYLFVHVIVNNVCKHNTAAVVWFCSFEKKEPHKCDVEDDTKAELLWNVKRGNMLTHKSDPGTAFDGSYYAYIEASKKKKKGDKAIMYLPFRSTGKFCLSFYYHMYGAKVGALQVIVRTPLINRVVWKKSGSQGLKWHFAEAFLNLAAHDKIGIRGIRGKGSHGDIGLDLLRIRRGPCVEKV